jgi:hypothetical protein
MSCIALLFSLQRVLAGSAAEAAADDSPVHLWAHDGSGNQYFFATQRSNLPAPFARQSSGNSMSSGGPSIRHVETMNVPLVPVTTIPPPSTIPTNAAASGPLGMARVGFANHGGMSCFGLVSGSPDIDGSLEHAQQTAVMLPPPAIVDAARAVMPHVGGQGGMVHRGLPSELQHPAHASIDFCWTGANAPSEGRHVNTPWVQPSALAPQMSLLPHSLPIQPLEPVGPWMFNPKPRPVPSNAPWGMPGRGRSESVTSMNSGFQQGDKRARHSNKGRQGMAIDSHDQGIDRTPAASGPQQQAAPGSELLAQGHDAQILAMKADAPSWHEPLLHQHPLQKSGN